MAIWNPKLPTSANIPSTTWTQVSTLSGGGSPGRRYARLVNNSTANTIRFLCLPNGYATSTLGATDGDILETAAGSSQLGGIWEENYDNISAGHIWIYSGSSTVTYTFTEGN